MNQTVVPMPPAPTRPLSPEPTLPSEIDELPLPYIEIDAHGLITHANRAAIALHHPDQGSLIGKLGWDLMANNEKNSSHAEFVAQVRSGGDPPVITRNLFDRSGKFRTYQLHRSLIRHADGKPAGMRMICVDVTETTQALNDALRTCQWLQSALESLTEAVFLVDALGVIRSMNAAAEKLSGFSVDTLIGKTIEEVSPLVDYQPLDGSSFSHLAAIKRPCRGIATLLNRDREQVKVELSTSPIIDKVTGSITGIVAILRKHFEF
jgi:PAS domain S-box-containing protein